MAKKLITLAVLASGFDAFAQAVASDSKRALEDILDIIAEKDAEINAVKSGLVETETKLDAAVKSIDEKSTALEAANKSIAEQAVTIETLTADLENAKGLNESLSDEIETLSANSKDGLNTKAGLSFKLDDQKYGFKFHSMMHHGKKITSEDVVKSLELQSQLVKIGSGMIKEL